MQLTDSIGSVIHWLEPHVTRFVISFAITFGAFVSIGGSPVDLSTTTGRAVAASAILHAVWAAFEAATKATGVSI